ncbi:MAG: glycine betaine ABC transporter substrate-binding protein [Spirochaetia bacterium]|nr:glycine betaine ABC transporter substrate-binding protein [Spirochaetia bacterium]MCF7952936.1 glycine betaine ABC transporter substrate-binding protein [Spirochaetales bacterium]
MKKSFYGIIAALVLFTAANSVFAQGQQGEQVKEANLVYVNWAEGVAYSHLAKVVLEDKMGYDVKITSADVGPAYTSVAQDDQDAFMECWRSLHQDYLDNYEGKLVSLGNVYEGTETGLAVPTYVSIDKISQLNEYADKFDGKITGIDAGAGMMQKTENELIPEYGLDKIKLLASSGPAMTASLKEAINNNEWIVVTAWKPHWMFGRWDLKFLEQDPDKMMWDKGDIEIIGRISLEEEKPELTQFLKNMYFEDAELADLMLKIEESDEDVETAAREWMTNNEDVVADWIP